MSRRIEVTIANLRRFALDPDYWLDSNQGRHVIANHVAAAVDHIEHHEALIDELPTLVAKAKALDVLLDDLAGCGYANSTVVKAAADRAKEPAA